MKTALIIFIGLMVMYIALTILEIVVMVTDERSVNKPPIYCYYSKGLGKVIYEYECLNTNEFLTDDGEVFDANVCTLWEINNG